MLSQPSSGRVGSSTGHMSKVQVPGSAGSLGSANSSPISAVSGPTSPSNSVPLDSLGPRNNSIVAALPPDNAGGVGVLESPPVPASLTPHSEDGPPSSYFDCHITDLAAMVASMLEEIVALNDAMPFNPDKLTRFHSRAAPSISVRDYILRIVKFCSLDKAILVVLLYFIDLLTQSYPSFVVTTLTIHRFIITSVTIASKGLCDSFCTNSHYAKVGGVSQIELNLLEVEFLTRVGYRIVPSVDTLNRYYMSMLQRHGLPKFRGAIVAQQMAARQPDTGSSTPVRQSSYPPQPDSGAAVGIGQVQGAPLPSSDPTGASSSDTPMSGSETDDRPTPHHRGLRETMKSMRKFLHPPKKKRPDEEHDTDDPVTLKRPKA